MAVNRTYTTSTGEKKEETEWFQIVTWRQLAEVCERYLHKGSKVYVEGRLTQRKYTDKTGAERTAVEVIASDVQFLSARAGEQTAPEAGDTDPFLPDLPE